jgi:hypothetical protein
MLARTLEPRRKAESSDLSNARPCGCKEEGNTESEHESDFELVDDFIDKICSHMILIPKIRTEVHEDEIDDERAIVGGLKRQTEAKKDEIDGKRAIFSGLLAAAIFVFWFYPRLST